MTVADIGYPKMRDGVVEVEWVEDLQLEPGTFEKTILISVVRAIEKGKQVFG